MKLIAIILINRKGYKAVKNQQKKRDLQVAIVWSEYNLVESENCAKNVHINYPEKISADWGTRE